MLKNIENLILIHLVFKIILFNILYNYLIKYSCIF